MHNPIGPVQNSMEMHYYRKINKHFSFNTVLISFPYVFYLYFICEFIEPSQAGQHRLVQPNSVLSLYRTAFTPYKINLLIIP